jgi:hypothetical protein
LQFLHALFGLFRLIARGDQFFVIAAQSIAQAANIRRESADNVAQFEISRAWLIFSEYSPMRAW